MCVGNYNVMFVLDIPTAVKDGNLDEETIIQLVSDNNRKISVTIGTLLYVFGLFECDS